MAVPTRRWLVLLTLVAAGAAAAAGYGLTSPKRYRATAQLLVAPVSASDSTFAGLDVLRDPDGKHGAAATAAVLVASAQVAEAVRAQLGVRRSVSALLDEVDAHVDGASDVVDVTVEDTSATTAAQLANAFVDALIAQRTTTFQSELGTAINRDRRLLAAAPSAPTATELSRRLAVLQGLQGEPDPTLRHATTAVAPTHASWPVLWSLVLIGAGVGLALGALALVGSTLMRRGRGVGDVAYARPMSDRAVNALVERLEQRLAARETALAVRERELQAKIDELRALDAGARTPIADDARERELHRREEAVDAKAAELAERERALAERVAAVTKRELATAKAQAAAAPAPSPPPQPAPTPSAAEVGGAFDIGTLERLVEARGAAFPERLDEWQSTLFFLRDYAEPGGTLPGSFDWLVQDTFGPLLT